MKRSPAGWIYLAAFITVGLSFSMLGPALTYLQRRADVSKGEIGVLFVAQSVGYLAGSLLSGRLYDHGYGHRAMAFGLVGMAGAALAIPHATSVPMLAIPVSLLGAFGGCVDVGGNTLVVWHSRRTGSGRLLNALHLFFGIGALLSPGFVNRSIAWSGGLGLVCGVIAGYSILIASVILIHETPVHTTDDEAERTIGGPKPQTPARILAVIGFFFVLYVGVEIGFSGWIKTYAEGIHLAGNAPTFLNTAFWVSFTLGRLLAVVLARRVRPGQMLAGSCALTVALLAVMALADGGHAMVWVTTPLIGIAVAPQFATMIAYAEERITLSGRSTSWFVSAAGIGGLTLPFLIGQLLDRSSGAMPIAVLVAAIAAMAWLLVVRRSLAVGSGLASV
jgi:fucose permease